MIVVIDGPAGSGKSSTAKAVADKLGIQYLDSGALYRALTLIYLKSGKKKDAFFKRLKEVSISFRYKQGQFDVFLNEEDVTERIREIDINEHVSEVAAFPRSRQFVNDMMREAIRHDVYIAEGRDLGTVVFPDAELKFFMFADLKTRAKRRYKELQSKGIETSPDEVRHNITERDQKDSQRERDPLRKADDAIEIDTTEMTFEQQLQFICSKVKQILKTEQNS